MSRLRAIWLVAKREIIERGRSRGFLVSLGLTVAFILAGIFLPSLIGGGGPSVERLAVVGTPPAGFAGALAAVADPSGDVIESEVLADEATAETRLRDGSLDAAVVFPADGSAPRLVVDQRDDETFLQIVSAAVSVSRQAELLSEAGVDPADSRPSRRRPSCAS